MSYGYNWRNLVLGAVLDQWVDIWCFGMLPCLSFAKPTANYMFVVLTNYFLLRSSNSSVLVGWLQSLVEKSKICFLFCFRVLFLVFVNLALFYQITSLETTVARAITKYSIHWPLSKLQLCHLASHRTRVSAKYTAMLWTRINPTLYELHHRHHHHHRLL